MDKQGKMILAVLCVGAVVGVSSYLRANRKQETTDDAVMDSAVDHGQEMNWSRNDDFFSSFTASDEFFGLDAFGGIYGRKPNKPKSTIFDFDKFKRKLSRKDTSR